MLTLVFIAVSPEPEFYIKTRDEVLDQFLVLACDGVWDVMTNEDICSFITHRMKVQDNLEIICNEVIDTCLYKVSRLSSVISWQSHADDCLQGSRDNMSIIIIAFASAPKVDPEAVKKENELNALLERKVTELIESHNNDVELSYVHQFLADEDIPNLPPGGGLASK